MRKEVISAQYSVVRIEPVKSGEVAGQNEFFSSFRQMLESFFFSISPEY
jgi:hypothetical protein